MARKECFIVAEVRGSKDVNKDKRFNVDTGRGSRVASEERGNVRSLQGSRDVLKTSPCSKDSGGELSKSIEVKKNEEVHGESGSSSEMEEGELQPEAEGSPAPERGKPEHEEPKPETEAEPKPESEPNRNSNQVQANNKK
ncbi:uncharacterized protein LOC122060645 [Macadamia integrifolia]|uniref:uncharacterized protein LOC122060645 n=1 Tax=Macadamia integrifolia TaxID=60698 RepID=UPI001C52E85F|nr:uncharacterized protein LOC122060645 [Macadamia integrifolia]